MVEGYVMGKSYETPQSSNVASSAGQFSIYIYVSNGMEIELAISFFGSKEVVKV